MWNDDDDDNGLPTDTDTPLSFDEYLALVISNQISIVSHRAVREVEPNLDKSEKLFRLGSALFEHWKSSKVHTLKIHIYRPFLTSIAAPLEAPLGTVAYPFLEYISRTTSLRHLYLEIDGSYEDDDDDDDDDDDSDDLPDDTHLIPPTIFANQSITDLTIDMGFSFYGGSNHNTRCLMHDIFGQLATRPRSRAPLQKVHLRFFDSGEDLIAESLGFSLYYQSLTERHEKMKLLKLTYGTFDDLMCEFLLDTHNGRCERIELMNCTFSMEACCRLALLMQMQPPPATNNNQLNGVDLSVRFECCDNPPVPSPFLLPSAGRIRLRELQIGTLSVTRYVPILAYHLPQSQYMNKLDVHFIWERGLQSFRPQPEDLIEANYLNAIPRKFHHDDPILRRKQMLNGIRRNGSLRCLELTLGDGSSFFSTKDERKVDAYLARNQSLPVLLANPRLDDDNDQGTDLKLFPPLFLAASAVDLMALANVLIGLSSAEKDGNYAYGPD